MMKASKVQVTPRIVTLSYIVLRSMQPLYRWQDPDMQAAMLNELRTVPEAGKQRRISCRINYDLIAEKPHYSEGVFLIKRFN